MRSRVRHRMADGARKKKEFWCLKKRKKWKLHSGEGVVDTTSLVLINNGKAKGSCMISLQIYT